MMWNDPHDGYGWGMHGDMGWGGWLMLCIFLLTFLAAVTSFTIISWRNSHGSRSDAGRVLAARYAKGEIDDEEFARRLQVLKSV